MRDARDEGLARGLTQWAGVFEQLANRIDGFVSGSEDSFTGFSGRLQAGMLRAGEVATAAAEAVELITGDDFHDTLDRIASQVADLESDLSVALEGTDLMSERFRGLRETLRRILAGRRDFGELVTMLRTLGVAARIQSSHLDQSEGGFMTLSEHVKELALQVDRRFRVVVDRSERLQHDISAAMDLASGTQEANRANLRDALGRVSRRLGDMRDTRALASNVGRDVALGSRDISGRITEIVMSMQFQDITRQRLENVRDALVKAADGMRRRAREGDNLGEAVARTRIIAGLERQQIRSASDTFSTEMTQILENVHSVVAALAKVQERILELGVETEGAQGSIFLRARRELDGIVGDATRMASEGRELSATLESSLAVATEMVGYVGDIDAIGTDLRNLALNAVVRSTATGDRGRPLVVIAEAIQEQSDESRRLTAHVSERLREIGAAASELGGLAREVAKAAEEGRELSSGSLDPLIALLHDTDARFNDKMAEVNAGVRELASSLSTAAGELTMHTELERLVDYVIGHFQRVETETHDCDAEGRIPSREEVLAQFQDTYAMSSQRDIHEAFAATAFGGPADAPAEGEGAVADGDGLDDIFFDEPSAETDEAETPPSGEDGLDGVLFDEEPSEGEDLGDNVELF